MLVFVAVLCVACSAWSPAPAQQKGDLLSQRLAPLPVIPAPRQVTTGQGCLRLYSCPIVPTIKPFCASSKHCADAVTSMWKDIVLAACKSHEGLSRWRTSVDPEYDDGAPSPMLSELALQSITVEVHDLAVTPLSIEVNASYTIHAKENGIIAIQSETIWGMQHAMETFAQLLEWNGDHFIVEKIPLSIFDEPRYHWRGILLDVSRHFLPLKSIRAILKAMSGMKLNVLHLHLTDSPSFPLMLKSHPELAKQGAYSPKAIYTGSDLEGLVNFANSIGIIIVPEIDSPGHTRSWAYGVPELIAQCPKSSGDTLDPSNPQTWNVLQDVISETASIFRPQFFHIGGDEVRAFCWKNGNSNKRISKWMKSLSMTHYTEIEEAFLRSNQASVKKYGARAVVWEEAARFNNTLAKDTIVQVWLSLASLRKAVKTNDAVMSFGYYQDKHSPSCRNHTCLNQWFWTSTFREMYRIDPRSIVEEQFATRAIGGEICVWGESVDADNINYLSFTRGIAVAERLWSSKEITGENYFSVRSMRFRCYMMRRGLMEGTGPLWIDYCEKREVQYDRSYSTYLPTHSETNLLDIILILCCSVLTIALLKKKISKENS